MKGRGGEMKGRGGGMKGRGGMFLNFLIVHYEKVCMEVGKDS